jgi:hypothetical protein
LWLFTTAHNFLQGDAVKKQGSWLDCGFSSTEFMENTMKTEFDRPWWQRPGWRFDLRQPCCLMR